ncbi:MAG TPA: hypothetical protein VEI95_18870 [Acidobacteriota bacterium]|nr:hypothetical protein [Acidobacteriota bacterium]
MQKNNLNLELLYIPCGSVIIPSIMSGDVKVANIAPPSAIGAWANFPMIETFDHR